MTDRDGLLAAVLACPDDDLPRLVYADWLEEHGEGEHAEFIRVQCKAYRTPHKHRARPGFRKDGEGRVCERCGLEKRAAELTGSVEVSTLPPRLWGQCVFHRGFPHVVACNSRDWHDTVGPRETWPVLGMLHAVMLDVLLGDYLPRTADTIARIPHVAIVGVNAGQFGWLRDELVRGVQDYHCYPERVTEGYQAERWLRRFAVPEQARRLLQGIHFPAEAW